jgi:hypothetical protein
LFGIITIVFFVLQANGVDVNWQCSATIYLICAVAGVWTTLRHATPGKRALIRYAVALAIFALFISLGLMGTTKQYRKEHQHVSTQAILAAKESPLPTSEKPHPAPPTAAPQVDIGIVLGADKGIGIDSIVDCNKPLYHCYTEAQAKRKVLPLDLGGKSWARLIFRIVNRGKAKLVHTSIHLESPSHVSIEWVPAPNPMRMPRNVLEVPTGGEDTQPFYIAKGGYAVPIDLTVPAGVDDVLIDVKVFGDNMPAHQVNFRFHVIR